MEKPIIPPKKLHISGFYEKLEDLATVESLLQCSNKEPEVRRSCLL